MRKILLALLVVVSSMTFAQAAIAADTVYVVRHLQKAVGDDPPLSAEGAANAQILADRLSKSGIKAIFATPTRRAMQTGEPLAKTLGLTITSYDPRDPAALIKAASAVNGAVLIVGHSNTVPDIVARLGGTPIQLTEQDYGTVFVVRPGNAAVEQVVLKAMPAPGRSSGARGDGVSREAVTKVAQCVVRKHHSEAARLVMSLGVNHETSLRIVDSSCVARSMELWPGALQAALANVLVSEEFPTFDASLIESAAALKQPTLNERLFALRREKTNKLEERRSLDQTIARLRAGIAFRHFGECVVRANSSGAHTLLMTKVASPEEAGAIQDMRRTFAQCPGLSSNLDELSYLRGSIAENYYRLARCGHDPLRTDCDPNIQRK